MTPIEMEQLYRTELVRPFPYKDCRRLTRSIGKDIGITSSDLIPDLDIYLADVAGFASSATRLRGRPVEQLRRYLPYLELSFFEKHPVYRPLEGRVNADDTPDLFRRLRITNTLRKELALCIRAILREIEDRQE